MSLRLGISSQLAAGSWQGEKSDGSGARRNVDGSRYRDLKAYRLSAALADELAREVLEWDKFATWTIGVQLVRAADSVGANIAEGLGRSRGPDRRRFLLIARGSLTELEHWIERATSRDLIDGSRWSERISEAARTLNGLIRTEQPA
jgi:four helix bundle protein